MAYADSFAKVRGVSRLTEISRLFNDSRVHRTEDHRIRPMGQQAIRPFIQVHRDLIIRLDQRVLNGPHGRMSSEMDMHFLHFP